MTVVQERAQPQEAFVSLCVPFLCSDSHAGKMLWCPHQDVLFSLIKLQNQTKNCPPDCCLLSPFTHWALVNRARSSHVKGLLRFQSQASEKKEGKAELGFPVHPLKVFVRSAEGA